MTPTERHRLAHTARRALVAGYGRDAVQHDRTAAVLDLLVDLRHFCDERNLDFGQISNVAYERYCEELHVEVST